MQKCALCEHEQETGEECENCGKKFPELAFDAVLPLTEPVSGDGAVSADGAQVLPTPAASNSLTCPGCQQPTAEIFCPSCGIRVRPQGFKMPAQPAVAAAPRAYVCPHCQQPTTELFCPTCAIRVRPRTTVPEATGAAHEGEPRPCSSCGQWTSAAVCPRCGVRMSAGGL